MAKITLENGITIEGTAVELAEMVAQMNANADVVVESIVEEGVVGEPAPFREEPLAVGDYAVVIKQGINGARVFTPGQIVKVTAEKDELGDTLRPSVKALDGRHEWYMTIGEEIRKATDEEVAKVEADAIERKKSAVFTDAGRKPNEYRQGDIIRYKGDIDGGIYEVSHTKFGEVHFFCDKFHNKTEFMPLETIEIVAFAEDRKDEK